MIKHRELAPPDKLLKLRDHEPIIVVPPQTWTCQFCMPVWPHEGAGTTVEWMGPGVDGPDGRCRECGQKYCLGPTRTVKKSRRDPLTDWIDGRWPFKYRFWAEEVA